MPPVISYADVVQLETLGMRAEALAKISPAEKTGALTTASRMIDGYLSAGGFTLPLLAIGADMSRAAAIIAAYDLLSARGFNPDQSASDQNVRDRYLDVLAWLKLVAQGTVIPSGIVDSSAGDTPGAAPPAARVASDPSRGYSVRGTPFANYRGPFQGG